MVKQREALRIAEVGSSGYALLCKCDVCKEEIKGAIALDLRIAKVYSPESPFVNGFVSGYTYTRLDDKYIPVFYDKHAIYITKLMYSHFQMLTKQYSSFNSRKE